MFASPAVKPGVITVVKAVESAAVAVEVPLITPTLIIVNAVKKLPSTTVGTLVLLVSLQLVNVLVIWRYNAMPILYIFKSEAAPDAWAREL